MADHLHRISAAFAAAALTTLAHGAEIALAVTDQHGKPVADAVVVAVPADGGVKPAARPRDRVSGTGALPRLICRPPPPMMAPPGPWPASALSVSSASR